MTQSVRALVPLFRESLTDDWDVTFVPTINGVRRTGMGSIAQATTPAGEQNNKELAYDYLTWFYAEDGGMRVLASTYAVVPPVTELFDSPIWVDLPPPPSNNRVFSESIEFGRMNPTTIPASVQAVVDAELLKAEQAVTLSNTSVVDALRAAEIVINEAMSRELAAAQ
jgi:ABC-type glycerol-3-phosphate transport system substrate-binding protein